jgi:Zn-dependent protease with chaperone function
VVHRHSQARLLQRQVVTYILQALVYSDQDPHEENFGEALGELLLQSANWLGQQSFSRKDEYQADATSWDLLLKSKTYNPQALQSLLEKLWSLQDGAAAGAGDGHTSWESTHPGTFDRIQALDGKWKDLSFQERRRLTRNII